jgi:hypothetical protein
MYHQELTAKESRTPPMIRAKIGDSLIDEFDEAKVPTLDGWRSCPPARF